MQLVLLMVSRQFPTSRCITSNERPLAMELMAEGKAVSLPVILTAGNCEADDFSKLENLPDKGRLVSSYRPHEQAWSLVEARIMKAMEKFRVGRMGTDMLLDYARKFRGAGAD